MQQHHQVMIKLDNKSEMVQHIVENHRCSFNMNQAIITEQEKNWNRRRVKETVYTRMYESINKYNNLRAAKLELFCQ